MEIRKKIDNSLLRKESETKNVSLLELLTEKLRNLSNKNNERHTLFAVCPNSENVLKAALRSAKRADSPILFYCNSKSSRYRQGLYWLDS